MEQRISIITLGVKDLAKAKAFYDALGWRQVATEQSEEIVAYDLIAQTLCLYPIDKLAEDSGLTFSNDGPLPFTLAYNVPSEAAVEDMMKLAEKCGATISKPAEKAFWGGYSGCFVSPDNHVFEIAYNPFANLGPKGEFQWNGVV